MNFMPSLYADHGKLFGYEGIPEDFYSSRTYTDKMLQWLEEKEDERPFFAMMTYTAPHWPLQAPREYINHYKGVYDDGPSALRQKRMEAMVKLGLIPAEAMDKAHPEVAVYNTHEWGDLSPQQRKRSSRIMEIYAGMVEYLDVQIGR